MNITDERLSMRARYELTKIILKEEVLPLIDNQKIRDYAKSNLRDLTNDVRYKMKIRRGIGTSLEWMHDKVIEFVAYRRPDLAKDAYPDVTNTVDPNHEQDLDDGNMGHKENLTGHQKILTEKEKGETPIEAPKLRIEEVVNFTVTQVTINKEEIIEIEIATFISLKDAKDFANEKEELLETQILLKNRRFYKISTKIVHKVVN